ncbi:MAG: hypothetical protein R3C03_14130 [Pirellulaceae bacterium]
MVASIISNVGVAFLALLSGWSQYQPDATQTPAPNASNPISFTENPLVAQPVSARPQKIAATLPHASRFETDSPIDVSVGATTQSTPLLQLPSAVSIDVSEEELNRKLLPGVQFVSTIISERSNQTDLPQETSNQDQSRSPETPGLLFDSVWNSFEFSQEEQNTYRLGDSQSSGGQPFAQSLPFDDESKIGAESLPLLPLPTSKLGANPLVPRSLDSSKTPNVAAEQKPTESSNQTTASIPDSEIAAKSTWTSPESTIAQLQSLPKSELSHDWIQSVRNNLEQLGRAGSLTGREFEKTLSQLQTQIAEAEDIINLAIRRQELEQASQLLRIRYELAQFHSLVSSCVTFEKQREPLQSNASTQPVFSQASFSREQLPELPESWDAYLMFDDLANAWAPTQQNETVRRDAALATLRRLSSPVLSAQQKEYLYSSLPESFLQQLVDTATTPVDVSNLLKHIELLKKHKSGFAAAKIAEDYQNLNWQVDSPAAEQLATEIETHLRNANFRLSVSDRMLNYLLPPEQEIHEPVMENVLGANVSGQSRIANRLQFRLIPDSSRIQMRLESIGLVRSNTEASRSGFTVQNVGNTRFHVFRRIVIGQNGIATDRADAVSDSDNQVVGIGSNLDPIPIVGWMARRMAQKQIQAQEPLAKQIVEQKLESTVKQRFENEIDNQLGDMQRYLYHNLIEPLTMLELEPTPVEMRSTDSRMVMRYRLAGRDQLAAYTTRPAGADNCLMSMQVHESTFNNMLNRLNLNGNRYTVDSLREHLENVLGIQPPSGDQEPGSNVDANLMFSNYDPIRVAFEDGEVILEFNLLRLQIGNGKTWKNLTASARYKPVWDGLNLKLQQNGEGVHLSGYRLTARDQIAARTVFTVLFQNEYSLNVLPATLAAKLPAQTEICQFDIVDGWVGLSLDERNQLLQPQWTNSESILSSKISTIPSASSNDLYIDQRFLIANQCIESNAPAHCEL